MARHILFVAIIVFVCVIRTTIAAAGSAIAANDDDPNVGVDDAYVSTLLTKDVWMRGEAKSLCVHDGQACYIANNNTLICKEVPGTSASVVLPSIQWSVLSCFYVSGFHHCGITTQGAIHCTDNTDLIPLGHSYVSISTTVPLSAAVTANGEAVLWGAVDSLRAWPNGEKYTINRWRVLLATPYVVCGLTLLTNNLKCFGASSMSPQWEQYRYETSWLSLRSSTYFFCGLLGNQTVRCWRAKDDDFVLPSFPLANLTFHRVWVNPASICGHVIVNDTLQCWHAPPSGSTDGGSIATITMIGSPSAIVDLACSFPLCVAVTATNYNDTYSNIVAWHSSASMVNPVIPVAPVLSMHRYDRLYDDGFVDFAVCGRLASMTSITSQQHNQWHCLMPPASIRPTAQLPSVVDMVEQWSWATRANHARLVNGSLIGFGYHSPVLYPQHVPAMDQTFIDLCTGYDHACGIRTNGTLVCWLIAPYAPDESDADKPWTGGAIHDDYVAITCTRHATCALRRNLDVYCWGQVGAQPRVRGPWIKVIQGSDNTFYGISAVTRMVECLDANRTQCRVNDAFNTTSSSSVLDIAMNMHVGCFISNLTGVLSCGTYGTGTDELHLPPRAQMDPRQIDWQPIVVFDDDTSTNHSSSRGNQLTVRSNNGVCLLVEGQIICSGHGHIQSSNSGPQRFRWGGHSFLPRASAVRIIHIARNGSDTPFCGLKYMMACATFNYAMKLIESVGPWTEFVFGEGQYEVGGAMNIDWTGITLRGTGIINTDGRGGTQIQTYGRLVVNAPSFKVINILFSSPLATPIVVNTGVVDVMIIDCVFMNMGEPILIVGNSIVTMIRSTFIRPRTMSINVYTSQLTMIGCVFEESNSQDGVAINSIQSIIVIHNTSFIALSNTVMSINQGTLLMTHSLFSACTGGAIVLSAIMRILPTALPPVFISHTVFDQCRHHVQSMGVIMISEAFGVRFTQCTWSGRIAFGSAIEITDDSAVTITDSKFVNHISLVTPSSRFQQHVIGCSLVVNSVFPLRESSLILRRVTFKFNRFMNNIRAERCRVTATGLDVRYNVAHQGTFIALYDGARIEVTNSVIAYNEATTMAAGFYVQGKPYPNSVSPIVIVNCTIVENRANTVGAVFVMTAQPSSGSTEPIIPCLPVINNTVMYHNNATWFGNDRMVITEPARLQLMAPASHWIHNHTAGWIVTPPIVFRVTDWFNHTYAKTAIECVGVMTSAVGRILGGERVELNRDGLLIFSQLQLQGIPGTSLELWVELTTTLLDDERTPVTRIISSPDAALFIHFRLCEPGERIEDLQCRKCDSGQYSAGNMTNCEKCALGRYQSEEGQTSCSQCARGYFQPITGQTFCHLCVTGHYTIDEGSTDCAKCGDDRGLTCQQIGGVRINEDYFASPIDYEGYFNNTFVGWNRLLTTTPCVRGRCISGDNYGQVGYLPCSDHRIQSIDNLLCGACEDGYTELISHGCIRCDQPNVGMIILVIMMLFILVSVLHVLAQSTSGLPPIFFYFVQISYIMLPSPVSWLSWIGLFNGSATSAAFGICIAPMTPGTQMALSICSIFIFWTTLAIILLCQSLLTRLPCCGDNNGRCRTVILRSCYPRQRYWRSVIEIYLFSYTTMANTLIGYMSCETVGDERVIFTQPTISCETDEYKLWLAIVAILFILLIVIPPVAFIVHLTRNRHRFGDPRFGARFGSLYEPFGRQSYWWKSFVLLRRVIFTLVDITLVILPSFKYMIFTFIHLLSLIIHILMEPYTTRLFNRIELATLIALTILAVILTAFPDGSTIRSYDSVQSLITVTVILPMIAFGMYGGYYGIHQLRRLYHRCWFASKRAAAPALLASSPSSSLGPSSSTSSSAVVPTTRLLHDMNGSERDRHDHDAAHVVDDEAERHIAIDQS